MSGTGKRVVFSVSLVDQKEDELTGVWSGEVDRGGVRKKIRARSLRWWERIQTLYWLQWDDTETLKQGRFIL